MRAARLLRAFLAAAKTQFENSIFSRHFFALCTAFWAGAYDLNAGRAAVAVLLRHVWDVRRLPVYAAQVDSCSPPRLDGTGMLHTDNTHATTRTH